MSQTRQRLSGLDGIRAFAVLAVIIFHANHSWVPGGYLGVEIFFVLSGFLITYLLICEHEKRGKINLMSFADRRLRRLVPALLVAVVLVLIYQVATRHIALGQTREDLVGALTYTANLTQIWQGQGYGAQQAFAPFRHFWSLAIEGQFYLLWPLAMVAALAWCQTQTRRYRVVAALCALTVVAVTVATASLFFGGTVNLTETCTDGVIPDGFTLLWGQCISINDALYLGTFPRIGGLIAGAALAFGIKSRPTGAKLAPAGPLGWLSLLCLTLVCAIVWLQRDSDSSIGTEFNPNLFEGGFFAVSVFSTGVIVAALNSSSSLSRVFENRVLTWIGTRSYGIYLFHWPIYQFLRQEAGASLTVLEFVGALAATAAISELSYRFVETPIRERGWLALVPKPQSAGAAQVGRYVFPAVTLTACTALAVQVIKAPNDCATTTECAVVNPGFSSVRDTSADNKATGSEDPKESSQTGSPTGAPSASATGTIRSPKVPGRQSQPSPNSPQQSGSADEPDTPASIVGTPYAVGESVMLEAAPLMKESGIVTTAGVSWNQKKMFPIVQRWASSGKLGSVLIIQVGTNSMVTDKTFDKFVEMVPATTTIYLMTVRTRHKVIPKNNAVIRNQPNRHDNVKVIDWHKESFKTKMCRDETHISCGGGSKKFYANLVNKAIGLPPVPEKPKPSKSTKTRETPTTQNKATQTTD